MKKSAVLTPTTPRRTWRYPDEHDIPPKDAEIVEVVACNIPSSLNEQILATRCIKEKSGRNTKPAELMAAVMHTEYSPKMVVALYEMLVQCYPPRYVAERYGLNVDSLTVAKSKVRALIKKLANIANP